MRASTGAMLDQIGPRWRMIGTLVHRGRLCSKTSVNIIQFGGEHLAERFGLISFPRFDDDYSGTDASQETVAPIIYSFLQEWHLDQVHDLLTRTFWSGIDSTS